MTFITKPTRPVTVDGFDDGDISEYSVFKNDGVTTTQTSTVFSGTHALKLGETGGSNPQIQSTSGLNAYPTSGDTIECYMRFEGASDSEFNRCRFYFGSQSLTKHPSGYRLKLNWSNNEITVSEAGGVGGSTASTSALPEQEWLRCVAYWDDGGDITGRVENTSGTELGSTALSGATAYDSGGVGMGCTTQANGETYFFDQYRLL